MTLSLNSRNRASSVTLFLSLKIFITVLQIITSASAGACRQVNPDSSKYSERRSMNLCLLPELDKNCDCFTASAVENSGVMLEQLRFLHFSLVLCEPCLLLNNNGIHQIHLQSYMMYTLTDMKHNWHICSCMVTQSSMQCDEEAYLHR